MCYDQVDIIFYYNVGGLDVAFLSKKCLKFCVIKIGFKVLKIMLLCCLGNIWFLIMSQGQFGHFMCHLTVLEARDDGKVRLENETSSDAKWVTNFVSGPRKKGNFKLRPNKKFSLIL